MAGALFVCGLVSAIMISAEMIIRYKQKAEKETEKTCEVFARKAEGKIEWDGEAGEVGE